MRPSLVAIGLAQVETPGNRSEKASSPVASLKHFRISGLCVRQTRSPTTIAEDKPSEICGTVHLRCVFVTSPAPVGSTHTPFPPRPLSLKTTPAPKAGEDASP